MSILYKTTIDGLGKEWAAVDQTGAYEVERRAIFEGYFRVFPWDAVTDGAAGLQRRQQHRSLVHRRPIDPSMYLDEGR